jgi:hypothetical protein
VLKVPQSFAATQKVVALHGVRLKEGPMQCKLCIRLTEATAISARPDAPNVLLGLSESGLRNRTRQKEELIIKAEMDLKKHQRSCVDRPAF